jgi:long-chain fatty acid transport protein
MNDSLVDRPAFLKPKSLGTAIAGLWVASASLFPSALQGVGFRMPNQDPDGIARGNAEAATADNPSAIYYNPAGITQLEGLQVRAGLYAISADTKYTSPTGVKAETDTMIQMVSQFYATYSFHEAPVSVGLGIYAPYGLALDWGGGTPFSTAAENGKLVYICFNPVIAWRIHPTLSVAVGPTVNYSEATLENGFSPLNPNDKFKFKGSDNAVGFNAGLRWQPHPMVAFGINYRSATTVDYDGFSQTRPDSPFPYYPATKTTAKVQFPQYVALGVSFRPTEKWNIEFDADWTDWDNVNSIIFKGTPLGDIPFILNYQSSWMYEFGVTRQLGGGFYVNLGLIYSENSSPEKYYNPIVPDTDLFLPGVGIGYHGKRWDWAVGYHCAIGHRHVDQAANPVVNGTYDTFNNAVNFSVTLKM